MIPDRPDSLTPSWLTAALADVLDGASVVDVATTACGTGQMADTLRLALTFDRPTPAPETVIAKMHAADPTSRATALALHSYEVEVRFFQELASAVPMRTPLAYLADIDLQTAAFVLLLEDMAPAVQGDQLAGCSLAEAEVAVDELVKLHAARWGDPALSDYEWLHRDPETSKVFLLGILPALWGGFVERYRDRLGATVLEAGDALVAALEKLLLADTRPWTILHGDYRLDNLLFGGRTRGVPIAVVDWQLAAHGPAMNDVAYFVGAGFFEAERREAERDLVRRYHAGLVAAGVADYSWEVCWHDYRRGTWSGLIVTIAAAMLVERTQRGDDMFMVMAHRHAAHVLDLDAPALLA